MNPPLIIRNLTSVCLDLTCIERYNRPDKTGWYNNISRSRLENGLKLPEPTSPALVENAERFTRADISIQIESFSSIPSEAPALRRADHESLRLTFHVGDQKYRTEIPFLTNASETLRPLAPNPHYDFTAVLQPDGTHLTIFDTTNLDCWMEHLKDETPLSALSIPGTHNSPTCYTALPSVRCQAVTPLEQLRNGVRFLDVRVQPYSIDDPRLALVHSSFGISLTKTRYFHGLLADIFAFLDSHPSETLILSLKNEGTGSWSTDKLYHILNLHYVTAAKSHRWYVSPNIPTLGAVRGKIVLMRRFALPPTIPSFGIDAHDWVDKTPHDARTAVCVQDFYEVLEPGVIAAKIAYAQEHCRRAAACVAPPPGPPAPFYLNFLSGSNFWRKGCWPERIAAALNPAMVRWLCCEHAREGEAGDGGTGIVVCDWVGERGDWDLVRCIVGMNSRLIARGKRVDSE